MTSINLDQQSRRTEVTLVVIAYLKVKPEHRETFLKLATSTGELTNSKEEGCISYEFYEDQNVKNLFFFFEEWASNEAFEAHLQEPHTKELVDRYPEILESPADIGIYNIKSVKVTQIPEQ
jgi:quinol monooxygenase YgiN